jgi:hypothetical protein
MDALLPDIEGNLPRHNQGATTSLYFNVISFIKHNNDGSELKIDIIKIGQGYSVSEILLRFNIDVCRSYFDGKKFFVPNCFEAFEGKTTLCPKYVKLLKQYVKKQNIHDMSHPLLKTIFTHLTFRPRCERMLAYRIVVVLMWLLKYKRRGIIITNLPVTFKKIVRVLHSKTGSSHICN